MIRIRITYFEIKANRYTALSQIIDGWKELPERLKRAGIEEHTVFKIEIIVPEVELGRISY